MFDDNAFAACGVNEPAVPEVHGHVVWPAATLSVEIDEIAGFEGGDVDFDGTAGSALFNGSSGKPNAHMGVGRLNEARAVIAAWAVATEDVGATYETESLFCKPSPEIKDLAAVVNS